MLCGKETVCSIRLLPRGEDETLIGDHIGFAILLIYVCVFSNFSYLLIGFIFIFA
jgi:hypothetical protein